MEDESPTQVEDNDSPSAANENANIMDSLTINLDHPSIQGRNGLTKLPTSQLVNDEIAEIENDESPNVLPIRAQREAQTLDTEHMLPLVASRDNFEEEVSMLPLNINVDSQDKKAGT